MSTATFFSLQSSSSWSSASTTPDPCDDTSNFDVDIYIPDHHDPFLLPLEEVSEPSDWKSAFDEIRRQMYSTTSVLLPTMSMYLSHALDDSHRNESCADLNYLACDTPSTDGSPHPASDITSFRQLRSENLITRIVNNPSLNIDKSTIMRLGQGVCIHTKWQPTTVYRRQSGGFYDMIQGPTSFVPCSYTFGARYTDAYGNSSDVLIRGHIPLWCQTMFLSEAVNQMPIRAGESKAGLFIFAPNVTVPFQSLASIYSAENEPNPELTMSYERLAMELSEPEMLSDESGWESRKQQVLERMLVCDVPDHLAQILTDMAQAWANEQGLVF
ncbi:hypothetical protein BX666DRAFT_1897446 [Dichotomocladium elegans]|nr:hypothetical protein BX666DRAFT_1897446 [Dichotomocladium elegans]